MQDNNLDPTSRVPIYRQIADILINEIASADYSPHEKFYTQIEIRKKYKVSMWVAREAINELVHRDLVYRLPQRGTFVKKTNIYDTAINTSVFENNLLYVTETWFSSPLKHSFFSGVFKGMEEKALKSEYYIEIFPLSSTEKKEILYNKIAQKKLGGIFLVGPTIRQEFITSIAETGVPVVLVDSPQIERRINTVAIDNITGAYTAVKFMIQSGHRKIGYLGKHSDNRNLTERFEGYKKALMEYNIPVEDRYIIFDEGSAEKIYGYNTMRILLDRADRPTAVFSGSDELAAGAVECIHDRNMRIPEDISIIGFNDSVACDIKPPISTMRVDKEEMGRKAVQMMIDIIGRSNKVIKVEMLIAKLIDRGTVAKINKI
jgi:LacI family transcriptional regulator